MAVVDAQDGDVPRSRHPRAGQESSIAAQSEDDVGCLQEIGNRPRLRVPPQLDGVNLPCPHRVKDAVDLFLLYA